MKEKKMFAFCLLGRNPEGSRDPVVRFGTDRKEVLERMMPFYERDGGMLCELEEFDMDPCFREGFCYVEMKNGIPWKLIHKGIDEPENCFWAIFIN